VDLDGPAHQSEAVTQSVRPQTVATTSAPNSPAWPTCDVNNCAGIQIAERTRCLAHLDPDVRRDFLSRLQPRSDFDGRGTQFTAELLDELLAAVTADEMPRFGTAKFSHVRFVGDANFREVRFQGKAIFTDAQFDAAALFEQALFVEDAWFDGARFAGRALFSRVRFAGQAHFDRVQFDAIAFFQTATFNQPAWFRETLFAGSQVSEQDRRRAASFISAGFDNMVEFHRAHFVGDVEFGAVRFGRPPWLWDVQVHGDVDFSDARFDDTDRLGPLVATGSLKFDRATFDRAVQIEAAAAAANFSQVTFAGGATLRLRHALVLLSGATTGGPLAIIGAPPFPSTDSPLRPLPDEVVNLRSNGSAAPRLVALPGVDAAGLVLCDVDLSSCDFAGSYNLEQLRMEGHCPFRSAPTGWQVQLRRWPPIWRWTRRQALAEEHTWRASQSRSPLWVAHVRRVTDRPERTLSPQLLAGLYRQLRKAHEDAGNEPGAADFYYGEMEMRRLAPTTAASERAILTLYWLVSGYGLRASRALLALAGVTAGTITLLVAYGLRGPGPHRWTGGHIDQAIRCTLNSVLFRSTDQPLTTAGSYIEMATRVTGPVLLALALLAIRNRVKR
jgi:uncharacterized protein YjbI with pentapeptide repeats